MDSGSNNISFNNEELGSADEGKQKGVEYTEIYAWGGRVIRGFTVCGDSIGVYGGLTDRFDVSWS